MASQFYRLFSSRFATASTITALGTTAFAVRFALGAPLKTDLNTNEPTKVFHKKLPQSLKLESSTLVNHNTKLLRFALPEKDAVSGLSLTSALLSITWPRGGIFPTVRPYTPVSDLNDPGHIDLLIKKYPDGKTSPYLHSLKPGDSVTFFKVPVAYQWKPNAHKHIVLIAGGAGITPMYQLTQGILSNPDDKTKITLVYGINTDNDALFEKEFAEYEKTFGERFRAVYTVSRPENGETRFKQGYVGKELLKQILQEGGNRPEKVFVCGPPAMETALAGRKGVLGELGFDKGQIHKF